MHHYHIECLQPISLQTLYCTFPQQHFPLHCTLNATTSSYGTIHWQPHSVPMAQPACQLTSLTKLYLHECPEFTDLGIIWLGNLMALRVLGLYWCHKITDVGVQYFAPLMSVTKLGLHGCRRITNKSASYLAGLVHLKDLDLGWCSRLTDVGIENLGSLTYLTYLNFELLCYYIRFCFWHLKARFHLGTLIVSLKPYQMYFSRNSRSVESYRLYI